LENWYLKTLFAALLLIILIFSAVNPAYGQEGDPPSPAALTNQNIRFEHLTSEDGLSTDSVITLL